MKENQGFIDENMFFAKNIPGQGMPTAMNSSTGQLTPEQLDSIINNTNEHPEVRKQAVSMKANLFPEPEIVVEAPKPKVTKKKKVTKVVKKETPNINNIIEQKQINDIEFGQFLQTFSTDIYADEIRLISNEDNVVNLRSLTVEEYKFLSKQLELFESRNSILDKTAPDYLYHVRMLEFSLTNALDVVLRKCITNDYPIENLTIYDWIYLLVYMRLISRGEEASFKITSGDGENTTKEYIDINISEMLDSIRKRRKEFIMNPMEYVEIEDGLGLYLMIPTRGDVLFTQDEQTRNPEASANFISLAMCVKAYVKDGVANIMSPHQRVQLLNSLSYEHLQKITEAYKKNSDSFFNVINEFIRMENPSAEGFTISDFILFFYDF